MQLFLVNTLGLALIALVGWWFWMSRARPKRMEDKVITIYVKNGVYEPARIQAPARKPIQLRFIREDPTPCGEAVIFPTLNRNYTLPMRKPYDVILMPQPAGEIEFTCHSGMYKGSLVIE